MNSSFTFLYGTGYWNRHNKYRCISYTGNGFKWYNVRKRTFKIGQQSYFIDFQLFIFGMHHVLLLNGWPAHIFHLPNAYLFRITLKSPGETCWNTHSFHPSICLDSLWAFASCLLITIYILNELSYDGYHTNADNIYRVTRDFNTESGSLSLRVCSISPPFGYYMPTDFPEIEKMTRLLDDGISPLKYKEKLFNETHTFWATNICLMFYCWDRKGDPKTALQGTVFHDDDRGNC